MEIRQTSIQAYKDINQDGTSDTQRLAILKFLRRYSDGLTRNEISRMLDIPINAVCGRVKELLKFCSIYEDNKRKDKYTHKNNYILKANYITTEEIK